MNIPTTKENIQRLKEACKGLFDDKSERNEILANKAGELFAAETENQKQNEYRHPIHGRVVERCLYRDVTVFEDGYESRFFISE